MPAEQLDTAARIFRAEARDGYRDRVVIGGLAGFVEKLRDSLGDEQVTHAAELLHDYAALAPTERAARLKQAHGLLAGVEMAQSSGSGEQAASAVRAVGAEYPTVRQLRQGQSVADRPDAPAPGPGQSGRPGAGTSPASPPPGVSLSTPIQGLKGIGPVRARLYTRLGILTVQDLLFHFPVRHQAFPPAVPIADLFFLPEGSVLGTLERIEVENLPRGLKRLKATINDHSGTVYAVWLRHGVARLGVQPGDPIGLSGKLVQVGRQLTFENPEYERAGGPPLHTRGLVPVHPLTAGLNDRELRNRIHWAVTHFAARVHDPLPEGMRTQHALLPIGEALRQMHFPRTLAEYADARRRFAFQELLTIQLLVLKRRMSWQHDPAAALPRQTHALEAVSASLPFALTPAQRRVTDEILHDTALRKPMTRLLQGEVGSGKTAVAALGLLNTFANGYQGALMAPTAILAEQHFATLTRLFEIAAPGLETAVGRRPRVTLLTGSITGKVRAAAYRDAASGASDVLVGTQALIQDKLEFARLGLVIVDEQHRFGVRQRVTLRSRGSEDSPVPHLLVMTATPIPRTLALSLYGDLDLSAIDEMPPGRQFPKTVLLGSDERHLAYERVLRAAVTGEQAFIICPLVEESEVLEARAATEECERLRSGELGSLRLGLLHGRMRPAEKDAVMRAFRDRELDVLVSTAVVEVGVDVPNATVMLIEGAERFGMAQLHQFRGRVGRGGQPSVCILLTDVPDAESSERLRVVAGTTNGLILAEHDLRLRGPGDYFGVRQSGLPELKVARLDDAPLVEAARSAASAVLSADPELVQPQHAALRSHLDAFVAHASEPS
ncbi:MAG: ATP-dependent DNA helicase RecG [Chloroflexota bacterium]|nr:ATP-dependent DNA helicase RecG [Chloroflexota bacterium]